MALSIFMLRIISKGARAEKAIAEWLGIEVMYQGENESWRV